MTERPTPHPSGDDLPGEFWFGGHVDSCKVTLRILGDDLDPDRVTSLLQCEPTLSHRKGEPRDVTTSDGHALHWKKGAWQLSASADDSDENEIEAIVRALLSELSDDRAVWEELTARYRVDLFCGLFLGAFNRGFSLSPDLMAYLGERGIEIGFDVYAVYDADDPLGERPPAS